MPATGPSSLPSTSPAASAGAKLDQPVKQIALCMAPASHNMVTISTTAQARPSASTSIVTGPSVSTSGSTVSTTGAASFLQTAGSANASAAGIPGITQLGLMVTRFGSSDRHQTVLFQPRAPGTRQAVVVSSPNPALGQRIVQIPNTTIRTIVQAGASSAQTVQGGHSASGLHVNITPVSNPTQPTVVKSTGITNSASSRNLNIPIDSGIGIVVSNDGANSRQQFRIHPQDMISVKSAPLNPASVKVARSPSASVTPAKVINLTSSSNVVNSTTQLPNSNVARLGIIQSSSSGSNNKTGSIISVTMPKNQAVIINPQSGHPTTANFASTNQTTHARPAIIPVNQVLTTITGQVPRHAIISAGSSAPGTQSTLTTQRILTTQHVQSQPNITISGSSPIKSAMTTSPIKQSIPTATPPSPRPSILTRKRNITDTHSSQGSSNSCSQQTKSSTIAPSTPVKIEQNIVETERTDATNDATDGLLESSSPNISSQTSTQNEGVTTPRKRTRKQLLEPFNPTKTPNIRLLPSTSEENSQAPSNRMVIDQIYSEVESSIQANRSDEDEQMDSDEGSQEDPEESPIIMPSNTNRPRLSMLNSCALPSKSLQYHFLRYSDVKPKPEKKLTLSELSNQVLQKKNGWKIHHLATQLEDTSSNEAEILERLQKILEIFEQELSKLPMDEELPLASGSNKLPVKVSLRDRLSDLIRGNIQRSLLYQDQSTESRQLLIKLTNDHREKVAKLTKKNLNKRTCISK